jgi:hypothetical protein
MLVITEFGGPKELLNTERIGTGNGKGDGSHFSIFLKFRPRIFRPRNKNIITLSK